MDDVAEVSCETTLEMISSSFSRSMCGISQLKFDSVLHAISPINGCQLVTKSTIKREHRQARLWRDHL